MGWAADTQHGNIFNTVLHNYLSYIYIYLQYICVNVQIDRENDLCLFVQSLLLVEHQNQDDLCAPGLIIFEFTFWVSLT